MRRVLCVLILLSPLISNAQHENISGIDWHENLSWSQVKAEARRQNKYLFVDCYASWCQPCKQMDQRVYPSKDVSDLINSRFLAVRIQMDKSPGDDEQTRRRYPDAAIISEHFGVHAYPTFLFFDPNGSPLHKAVGYRSIASFIALLKDVFNPSKQYYTLIKDFKPGSVDTSELKGLARTFETIDPELSGKLTADYFARIPRSQWGNDDNIKLMAELQKLPPVTRISLDYITALNKTQLLSANNARLLCELHRVPGVRHYVDKFVGELAASEIASPDVLKVMIAFKDSRKVAERAVAYLSKLDEREVFVKMNIELLSKFTNSSTDFGFPYFCHNGRAIDSLMGRNYSQSVLDRIIDKEEILPVINARKNDNTEPNWDSLVVAIKRRFPDPSYGERNVLWARLGWCKEHKDIPEYIKYMILFFDNYMTDTTSWLIDNERNNFAWDFIFLQSMASQQIKAGIRWMRGVVRRDGGKHPTYIDTYANLLYKAGETKEAISLEREACRLDSNDKSFEANLSKMLSGKPTWNVSHPVSVSGQRIPAGPLQPNLEKYLWSYAKHDLSAARQSLDFDAIDNWQGPGDYLSVSDNGKYFAYDTEQGIGIPFNYGRKPDSLILQSVGNTWRQSFARAKPGFFARKSDEYIFQKGDTLFLIQLDKKGYKTIGNVESYTTAFGVNDWVAFKLKDLRRSIILLNLTTGKERRFDNANGYSFDNSNRWFCAVLDSFPKQLCFLDLVNGGTKQYPFGQGYLVSPGGDALLINNGHDLKYVDLSSGNLRTIWQSVDTSKSVADFQFDQSGKQVAFSVKTVSNGESSVSIWYYQAGRDRADIKAENTTLGDGKVQIKGLESFTGNGSYIQFRLAARQSLPRPVGSGVNLDVLSYKDLTLETGTTDLSAEGKTYRAVVSVKNNRILRLDSGDKRAAFFEGDFALIVKRDAELHGDRFWEFPRGHNEDSNWVLSLKDGVWHLLPTTTDGGFIWITPGNHYLVYFDAKKGGHYYSYNLQDGRTADVCVGVPEEQFEKVESTYLAERKSGYPYGPAAWLKDDRHVLVFDANDIWKLDLSGREKAINVTNGFGRRNKLVFRVLHEGREFRGMPVLDETESYRLHAVSLAGKTTAFYASSLAAARDPRLLSTGNYFTNIIKGPNDPNLSNDGRIPLKAKDASIWIVQRQSIADAPNYYATSDFKVFQRLTDIQPQTGFNWISEELHSFAHLDGKTGQGILYKPEDFDSSKKYPVLIVFYGKYSGDFNQFPEPSFCYNGITAGTSPAWLVSNGFLVFTPDIEVAPLRFGPAASNVIEGAVNYLKKLSFVDSTKFGFSTHSWSSKLGAYIFTHSRSFAAAMMSEGFLYANLISAALSTNERGENNLEAAEQGFQYGNLWKNKASWLDQTTVLNVDKSRSPLLLLCNKKSTPEYQNQTFQLFNALRRLRRPAWWLRYDKGWHNLSDRNEQKDFTIRYTQYFDHYLNRAPAPKWMTRSIPGTLIVTESSYELDPQGSCSKDCPVCKAWNAQYKRKPEMFGRPLAEWKLDDDLRKQMEEEEKNGCSRLR